MPETPFERILAVGTLLAAAALVVMVATNWDAFVRSPVQVTQPALVGQQAPVEAVSRPRRPVPAPDRATRRSAPTKRQAAPPQKAELVIAATRGPSWLEVRAENPGGVQLYFGMLDEGSTTRFDRLPVWVRLGAAESVDITLGSSPIRSLPVGDNGVVQFIASEEDVTAVSTG